MSLATPICLMISTKAERYLEAKRACSSITNGRLFAANRKEKIAIVRRHTTTQRLLIGLNDLISEGRWIWSDGKVMTKEQGEELWGPTEPDEYRGEDCVIIFSYTSQLHDVRCSRRFIYFCEVPMADEDVQD